MFKINKMTKNLRNECFNKQMPVFIILFIAIFQSNRVLADEQKGLFMHVVLYVFAVTSSICMPYKFGCVLQLMDYEQCLLHRQIHFLVID